MRKYYKLLAIPVVGFMISCGGEETPVNPEENIDNTQTAEEDIDYSDMKLYDLSTHSAMELENLPLKMRLPLIAGSDHASKPEVICHNEISWEVKVGDKFHIVIEPWGDVAKTVSEFKSQIETDGFYSIAPFSKADGVIESENELLYTRVIKSSESELGDPHFFYIKQIDGEYYTIRSHDNGGFLPIRVKDMLRAAKSIEKA